jgi:membrane-bound acyltransferase YfiQ involved in biofilm formation
MGTAEISKLARKVGWLKLAVAATLGALVVVIFSVWILDVVFTKLDPILKDVADWAVRLFGLIISLVSFYQGYDSLRAGITGTQSKVSRAVKDPGAMSARLANIFLGVVMCGLAVVIFCLVLGLL